MADAAKSARGAFTDIKSGADEMSAATGYSMTEARHSVTMLADEFGIHLPRALSTFIAGLGPIGPALEAAFPFVAVGLAATLLIEHLGKVNEEAGKTAQAWRKVGDVGAEAFSVMQDRLLQAEIKADELAGNHLGALERKLQLIDRQTMGEIVGELDKVAAAADTAFSGLEQNWFIRMLTGHVDVGPEKQQLEDFISGIDRLKQSGAKPGDIDSLVKVDVEKVQQDMTTVWNRLQDLQSRSFDYTDRTGAAQAAANARQIAAAQDEWNIKQRELETLTKMQQVAGLGTKVDTVDKDNERTEEANREQAAQDQIAEAQQRGLDEYVHRAQEAQKKAQDLKNKDAESEEELAHAKMRSDEAFYTMIGKKEEEREKLAQEGAKDEAEHETRMGELKLAAIKERDQSLLAQGRITAQQMLADEKKAEADEYANQRQALNTELAGLNQQANDYQNRKQALNNKLEELQQQHDNKMQQLDDQAAKKQLTAIQAFANKMQQDYAQGFTQVIMGKESFAKAMQQIDSQLAASALKWALTSLESLATVQGRKRLGDARTAAADAYADAGNPITGTIAAAEAFAKVMSFESGGIVPGVGKGDTVPAMLTPGETVLTKALTDKLSYASKFGGDSASTPPAQHIHNHHYNISAIDGASVQSMLDKHSSVFERHATSHFRKMNK